MDRKIDGWIYRKIDKQIEDRQRNRLIDRWMDREID